MENLTPKRDGFSSKFGIIAAAAGSAIGLGNIWKFPYIVGENGGAAFIIIYLLCIALIGAPVMLSEFVIGRRAQKNAVGSFKKIAPNTPWFLTGWMGLGAAFMILSFYGVVAGWTIYYVIKMITNAFASMSPDEIGGLFGGFITGADGWWLPIIFQVIFMAVTAGVILGGVKNGIEKYSKILMPLLLLIIIILDIKAITLKGSSAGVEFLFKPEWGALKLSSVLDALGHAFFSLSLGMGTMITYGSYISKKENIGVTSIQVTIADTLIALLAGLAIFPAVFAFGIEPGAGPGLVFVTLPNVFNAMGGIGQLFGVMFFVLLAVAALTSSISILEVVVAYMTEEMKMDRTKATVISTVIITLFGVLCSLSLGPWEQTFPILQKVDGGLVEWYGFFDWFDKLSGNFLLPLGGLFISLFVGWKMTNDDVRDELSNSGVLKVGYFFVFDFLCKFVAPLGIVIVFLYNLGFINL
jgi:NSS family neurotransmitter:Na+ symporter